MTRVNLMFGSYLEEGLSLLFFFAGGGTEGTSVTPTLAAEGVSVSFCQAVSDRLDGICQ